jgi:hypothetical protein
MPARNLPTTSCQCGTGRVNRISMVPTFCSSLHRRIDSAPTRKMSRSGSQSNIGRTSAMLRVKNLATQKNVNSTTPRKVARKISATAELK